MLTIKESLQEKKVIEEMTENFSQLTPSERKELIRLKCRNELLTFMVIASNKTFKPYDVHRLVTGFVQKTADDDPEYERTIVSLPPRVGKSTIISQYLPAWQLGRNPCSSHILSSHTLPRSQENVSTLLEIIANPNFKKIFPEFKLTEKGASSKGFKTSEGGGVLADSVQKKISGFDAGTMSYEHFPGFIIMDDLLSKGFSVRQLESAWKHVEEELITRGLPNKAIISMGTRFHANDVSGRLIEASPELWKILNVPALCVDESKDPLNRKKGESIWEECYPAKELRIIQKIQDTVTFNTIYQGQPPGSKGNYVLESDITYVDETFKNGICFFSVDTSFKGDSNSDYNCVAVWRLVPDLHAIALVDVLHLRCDFYALLGKMKTLINHYRPHSMVVEGKANGDALVSMLEKEVSNVKIHGYTPLKSKTARLQLVVPELKRGQVLFYSGITNLEEYVKELTQAPYVKHDDFVDALTLGIQFWTEIMSTGDFWSSGTKLGLFKTFPRNAPIDTTVNHIGWDSNEFKSRDLLDSTRFF